MRTIPPIASVLALALCLLASCGLSGGDPGSVTRSISDNASHACDGLAEALANCPNAHACDVLQREYQAHGCAPACPCTAAPVPNGAVSISKCPIATGGSLALCYQGADVCSTIGFGGPDNVDPAICAACRQQYGLTCGP